MKLHEAIYDKLFFTRYINSLGQRLKKVALFKFPLKIKAFNLDKDGLF